MKRAVLVTAVVLGITGCATSFTGAPKVKNGPQGCRAACEAWGMDLAGMVKMGEYSDGCICQVRPAAGGAPAAGPSADSPRAAGPSGSPAVAGVWVQMQAAAAAAQQTSAARRATAPGSSWQHPYVPGSPVGSPGWRPGMP